jgi:geranylgeranyl diphosphate synthase type I
MIFSEFRSWFDERFSLLLQKKIATFTAHSSSKDIETIASYIETLGQGGKRFRPFLISLGAGATKETQDQYFSLYAAVELLHLFALIHDDIMDKAETRHGVLCAHSAFRETYGAHTGEAITILLGDIVFSWAYECLFDYIQTTPEKGARLHQEFQLLVSEVTHGQLLDVLSPQQPSLSEMLLIEKMTLKTARYSFVRPLALGFIVRGDSADDQAFASAFGTALGIAFQLQDDLLDSSVSTITGKSSFTDIQTKQQTLLSWYMEHEANDEYKIVFQTLFGKNPISQEETVMLTKVLEESGAYEYIKQRISFYMNNAQEAVTIYNREDVGVWESVISLVSKREK